MFLANGYVKIHYLTFNWWQVAKPERIASVSRQTSTRRGMIYDLAVRILSTSTRARVNTFVSSARFIRGTV